MSKRIATATALLAVACLAGPALPEVQTHVYGPYTRYELTLAKAFRDGRDVVLHLGAGDGRFHQAWATVPGLDRTRGEVDASGLHLSDGRIRGEAVATLQFRGEGETYVARYMLDVTPDGARAQGSYEGRWGVRGGALVYSTEELVIEPHQVRFFAFGDDVSGNLAGDVQPRLRQGRLRAELNLQSVLEGGPSDRFRRAHVVIDLLDGRAAGGTVHPLMGSEAGWSGTISECDLRLTDDRLAGTLTLKIDSKSVAPGEYTIPMDAQVVGNSVFGRLSSALAGRPVPIPIGKFGGRLVAADDAGREDGDRVLVLTLARAIEGSRPVEVHLRARGARLLGGIAKWKTMDHMPVDAAKLTWADGRLAGDLQITYTPESHAVPHDEEMPVVYHLSAKADGTTLAGTHSAVYGRRLAVKGTAAGSVRSAEEIRRTEGLAPGKDWPFWNGPTSNFAAAPSGHELVDDLSKARLVWRSEHTPPARCQTTRYGEGNVAAYVDQDAATGGGCSPVVAGGRVYLYYFLPSEKGPFGEDYIRSETAKGNHVIRRMWSHTCDDVVVCIDAATGGTLWKTTFRGEGLYFGHHGTGQAKGAFTSNVAVADGRAYVHTTGGKTHCLDAGTGDVLWTTEAVGGPLRVVADGVLVPAGDDLVGIDGKTGAELWRIRSGGARDAQPVRWVHGGKEYVLAGNAAGQVRCVEPRSGKVRWTIEEAGTQQFTMTACGPFLLLNGVVSEKNQRDRLGCYRISPDKAERLWVLDGYDYIPHNTSIASHGGYGYLRVGTKDPNRLICVELATGKVVADIASRSEGASGYTFWADGRVLIQRDASHGLTPLRLYNADPKDLRPLGETWDTQHRPASSYYPILITHAFADGRVFIRGGKGVYCYDLRKTGRPEARDGPPDVRARPAAERRTSTAGPEP